MTAKAEQKERTHASILDSAANLLRTRGISGARVADVMKGAGLTVGGFYAHFESKDALIAAAIDEMFAEARSRQMLESGDKPPAEALAAYIDFYLSPTHRDARASGCPMPSLAADLPRLTAKARERFAAGVSGLRARIAERLAELGFQDAEAQASSMVAELVGALSLARAEPDPAASDAVLANSKTALKYRFSLEP
jgi:TetR/AcrR family transcriptional repressor of nem operon